jgi:flagellar hook-associated protein 3 FlgL
MSITGIQNPFFQTQTVANLQSQLVNLQNELGTGQVSQSYAGVGNNRGLAISLQAQLASLGNFGNVINTVNVRLSVAQQALTQIATSADLVHNTLFNSKFTLDQTGQTGDQGTANGQLQQVIDTLNTQVGDNYIFSGTAATTPAVVNASQLLNGNGAQAGLKQVISERAQADLGANGLGRLVIPAPGASPAHVAGTTATLLPDAAAMLAGTQNIGTLSSAGGTLVINGQSITINPGDNAAAILSDINGQIGTTGVTATLDPTSHLVLTSANSTTPETIGAGTSASLLTELGISVGPVNPVNLVTQNAVANNDQLVITVGANPALTVTFGTGAGQIDTLQGLNTALQGLVGGAASVDSTDGNISITATNNNTDTITTAFTGAGPITNFGISAGVTPPTAGTRVSLSEDVAGSVFGMKIASVSSTLTGATVAGPTGSPPAAIVDLGALPKAGDTLTYSFNLPDGTTQQLVMTATTASPPGTNQFTIGATPTATATNLQPALTTAVSTLAATSLTAASAVAAAGNFFNSSAASPPLRVNGPPFTATSLIAGTSANTLSWYSGEAGAAPPRSTATAQVDPSITVSYGMRANESALRNTVQNLAVMSALTFSPSDPNAAARYAALTQRVATNMNIPNGSRTVTDIEADIAGAQTAMKTASDNHTQMTGTLTDMVQNIEGADTNTVGAQLLDLQNRLQASLQVTAMLAHTNLASILGPNG